MCIINFHVLHFISSTSFIYATNIKSKHITNLSINRKPCDIKWTCYSPRHRCWPKHYSRILDQRFSFVKISVCHTDYICTWKHKTKREALRISLIHMNKSVVLCSIKYVCIKVKLSLHIMQAKKHIKNISVFRNMFNFRVILRDNIQSSDVRHCSSLQFRPNDQKELACISLKSVCFC